MRLAALFLAAVAGTAHTARVVTCGAGQNCTTILQDAIDTGGDNIVVRGNFTVRPIFLRSSDQTITFAPGAVVAALPGSFHGANDCLFTAHGVENLTVLGYGSQWTMRRRDYNDSGLYAHSEWRHGLSIMSSVDVRVRGVRISETGGDGIYVYGSVRVELTDVVTDGAYRNGLSIISGNGVQVVGCRFRRTAGTPPEAGVDIEPNSCKPNRSCFEYLSGVRFRDLESTGNLGTGLSFSLGKLAPNATIDISVENATIQGAAGTASDARLAYNIGVLLGGKKVLPASPGQRGAIALTNVTVRDTAQPAVEVYGHLAGGARTALRGCRLGPGVATAAALRWGGTNVPILLHQSAPGAVGGLELDGVEVVDDAVRPFIKCDSCAGRGAATAINGSVTVRNAHPEGCAMDLGPGQVDVAVTVNCTAGLPGTST